MCDRKLVVRSNYLVWFWEAV